MNPLPRKKQTELTVRKRLLKRIGSSLAGELVTLTYADYELLSNLGFVSADPEKVTWFFLAGQGDKPSYLDYGLEDDK